MPGRINSTNNFAVTPYIVGTVLGNHCNYTVIQEAIDDSFNSGTPHPIWIQQGMYTENLTMRGGVDVIAAGADGRLQNDTHIIGSHTYSDSGSAAFSGIFLSSSGSDLFTVSAAVPGQQTLLVCKFCAFDVTGGHLAVQSNPGGGGCVFAVFECQGGSDQSCIEMADGCIGVTILSTLQSGDIVFNANGAGAFVQSSYSQLNGTNACISINDPNAGAQVIYDVLSSGGPTINFNAAGNVFGNHNTHNSNSGSTFYIDGLVGGYAYTDDTLLGSAVDINPAISISNGQWRPRATADVSAAAAFAGTASFDSSQFTVSDGFVQLISPSGSFPWNDISSSLPVSSNNGYFVLASITLTLPVAPAQGDVIKFAVDGAFVLVIQTSAPQLIKIGNQTSAPSGTATSSQDGDTVELVYRLGSNTWEAISVIGNWLVV